MNILITGSSGFVGSRLVSCFNDDHVVGLDCFKSKSPDIKDHWVWDISQPIPETMTLEEPVMIHAAASIDGEPETLWKTNVMGTKHVLDWAVRNRSPHIIFFSTGGIYGYNADQYVDESYPVAPANPYGHSKFLGESLMMMYHRQFNIPVTILRIFFPFGPGVKRGIFYHIREAIQNGTPLKINKNGSPKMNPIHIDDVVDITKKIAIGISDRFNMFNLCGEETISFLDLVKLFEKGLGQKAIQKRSGEICGDLLGDCTLIQRVFSWRPHQQISEISDLKERR